MWSRWRSRVSASCATRWFEVHKEDGPPPAGVDDFLPPDPITPVFKALCLAVRGDSQSPTPRPSPVATVEGGGFALAGAYAFP